MRKSQASMEHVMIVAVSLLILVPMIYLFYSYSQGSTEGINLARLNRIGKSVVNHAESIYYLGEPSKITIEESMPDGIKNMTIISNFTANINELIFTLADDSEVSFSSNVNINGTFNRTAYSQGLKTIQIESKGNFVLITIT